MIDKKVQLKVYVTPDTLKRTKIKLIQGRKYRSLSYLIEHMLGRWLITSR